ncbi:DUF3137 domain-containing protein [Brevibacillus sp. GCM10020057]|uniref:DUF3137 domain-containing protein n=1 Tax=Brevibacillus sp. GCM10020057 TaxID=3317327 RepID=UPI00363FDDE3
MLPTYHDVKHAISPSFDQLEELRRRLVASRRTLRFILFSILALNIICYLYAPAFVLPAFAGLIIMIIVYWVRKKKAATQFRAVYKNQIVAPLTQKMVELCRLPNHHEQYSYVCEYHPTGRVGDDLIHRSHLFPYKISSIQGEDLFIGKLGLTNFQFSELKIFQEQDGTDDGMTQELIMFQGVLFVADFHKDFEGLTVLTGNMSSTNSRVGKFMTQLSKKLLERRIDAATQTIKLENEAFNKAFQVRVSHEGETRYILSSSMMERLLEFKNSGKGRYAPINISSVDSCMFVSIWNHKDQFEGNINQEINNEAVEKLYQELCFYFGLIEDFDLNSRTWSKA